MIIVVMHLIVIVSLCHFNCLVAFTKSYLILYYLIFSTPYQHLSATMLSVTNGQTDDSMPIAVHTV